jgi:hypothetical protein
MWRWRISHNTASNEVKKQFSRACPLTGLLKTKTTKTTHATRKQSSQEETRHAFRDSHCCCRIRENVHSQAAEFDCYSAGGHLPVCGFAWPYQVVATYADPGCSGLEIKDRMEE